MWPKHSLQNENESCGNKFNFPLKYNTVRQGDPDIDEFGFMFQVGKSFNFKYNQMRPALYALKFAFYEIHAKVYVGYFSTSFTSKLMMRIDNHKKDGIVATQFSYILHGVFNNAKATINSSSQFSGTIIK